MEYGDMDNQNATKTEVKNTTTDKLPVKQIIKETLETTKRSSPWILKNLTLYFACYYIPLAIAFLWTAYAFWFPPVPARMFLSLLITMMGMAFAIFITPYYVYRFNENEKETSNKSFHREAPENTQESSSGSFWDFVKENVTPLVINYIKKSFVILGYFLLLIVPGLVKIVRLTFVTQATFFDPDCQKGKLSALKASHDLTKGFFVSLVVLFVFMFIGLGGLSVVLEYSLKLIFGSESNFSSSVVESFGLVISFYMQNLVLIFITQLYFSLRKAKNLP